MPALEVFADFMFDTGPAIFSGPEDLINETAKNTYVLPRFLKGREMSEMVQGGSKIRDMIFFDEASTFHNYHPSDIETWDDPQVQSQWEIPWRFSMGHMAWNDQTVGLNNGDLSQRARFHKYKTLKHGIEMNLWSSFSNGLEDQLFAAPNTTTMEATTGKVPYSLFAFVNEFSAERLDFFETTGGAAAPTRASHPGHFPGWTTVQTIDPGTQTKWQNQKEGYGANETQAAAVTAGDTHLFEAFDRMYKKVMFQQLPVHGEFSERATAPAFIMCSLLGATKYEAALRMNQDWFRYGGQDPAYPHPKYRNVDVVYVDALGDAPIYGDLATATGTETNPSGTPVPTEAIGFSGPRYYFINAKYMGKAVHRERYFYKKKPFNPSGQPWNWVCPVDIWHNNYCRSRRRHGVVSPYQNVA